MAIRYVDLVNGNDANDGSTFALRKKTIASAATGLGSGDVVRVMASPAATATGVNATWTNGSDVVTLASPLTQTVDNCEVAWTSASANVLTTVQTNTFREGTLSARMDIKTAFTTGLVAYRALGSTVNLSGFQQLSFLIRTDIAVAANVLTLSLCSDAAGATPVNTVNIPAVVAGEWTKVVVDTGAALGSAIQSIALNAASDPANPYVFLDNIIACKAASSGDSITHKSLISKTGSGEAWFSIESIDGTTITLTGVTCATAAKSAFTFGKYWGSTATVPLFKREPITLSAQQSINVNVSGDPSTSFMTISGGWNTTDMSSQTDRTYLRHNQNSVNLISMSASNIRLNAFGLCDANNGLYLNSSQLGYATDCVTIGCTRGVSVFNCPGSIVSLAYSVQCRETFSLSGTVNDNSKGPVMSFYAGYSWGISTVDTSYMYYHTGGSNAIKLTIECPDVRFHNRGLMTLGLENVTIRNTVFNNCAGDIAMSGDTYAYNTTFTSSTLSSGISMGYATLFAQQLNGDATKHGQWSGLGWKVLTATDQRHTASDVSWKFTALSSGLYLGYTAAVLCVAQLACLGGQQRSVSLWFRKDNASVAMRLRVGGGFVAGIASDVISNMTAGINTWEQLTVVFTPTNDCVVQIHADFAGPNFSNGWVDDLSVA